MTRNSRLLRGGGALALAAALGLAAPAMAQKGARQPGLIGEAADAITTPLEDLNLAGRDVPAELMMLQLDPYSTEGLNCASARTEIARLNEILGPDADEPGNKGGLMRTALKAGGSFLGSFIPFRGVIREVSGANAKKRRMEDAVYVGVARRSFLKGYAGASDCLSAEELAVEKARRDLEALDD